MKPTQVLVNTREFEFDHGKLPRGTGRWAFGIGERRPAIENVYWFTGSYGTAVKGCPREGF